MLSITGGVTIHSENWTVDLFKVKKKSTHTKSRGKIFDKFD